MNSRIAFLLAALLLFLLYVPAQVLPGDLKPRLLAQPLKGIKIISVRTTDSSGKETGHKVYELDSSGRLIREEFCPPAYGCRKTLYSYDAQGRLTKEINSDLGGKIIRTAVYRYFTDSLGRQVKELLLNGKTSLQYFESTGKGGKRVTRYSPASQRIEGEEEYDTLGRLTRTSNNSPNTPSFESYTYDEHGNIRSVYYRIQFNYSEHDEHDVRHETMTNVYDNAGRLVTISYDPRYGPYETISYRFSYNEQGLLSEMSTNRGEASGKKESTEIRYTGFQ